MKIKIIATLVLAFATSLQAQELTVKIDGGFSGINYKSNKGSGDLKTGGGIGLGYTYYVNSHWGIQTGIEARYHNTGFTLYDKQKITTFEVDDQGSAFEYRVQPTHYKEAQHFYSIALPLMMQFRTAVSNTTQFYLGLGGKVLIPGKQNVAASAGAFSLSGYYPDLNLEIDDLPNHGFGKVAPWKNDSSIALRTSILLSLEGGLSFKLNDGLQLFTGIYADYGLTDMQQAHQSQNIVGYSPAGTDQVAANGVMATTDVLDQSRYLSAGIQLKMGFALGNAQKASVVEPEIVEEKIPFQLITPAPPSIEKKTKEQVETPASPTLSEAEYDSIEAPLVFGTINGTEVTPSLSTKLDSIALLLKKDDTINVTITGHTCDMGKESLNQTVALKRAQSVADYLAESGISRNRLSVRSKGETDPLVPNTSLKNRMQNRRVSIAITTKN